MPVRGIWLGIELAADYVLLDDLLVRRKAIRMGLRACLPKKILAAKAVEPAHFFRKFSANSSLLPSNLRKNVLNSPLFRSDIFKFRKNKNSEQTGARARNAPFGSWRKALTCSTKQALNVMGTVGVLLLACKQGHIMGYQVYGYIDTLIREHNMCLSDELIVRIKRILL